MFQRDLLFYAEQYAEALKQIFDTISDFANPQGITESVAPFEAYQTVLESHLSKMCNDASLILRKILELEKRDWPDWCDEMNTNALQQVADETLEFCEQDYDISGWTSYKTLGVLFLRSVDALSACLQTNDQGNDPEMDYGDDPEMDYGDDPEMDCGDDPEMDYKQASVVFLRLAVGIEEMLGNMLTQAR
jgi:hypothetical protein